MAARTRRLGGRSAVASAAATEYTLTGSGSRVEPYPMSGSKCVGFGGAGHELHPLVEQHDARPALAVRDGPVQQDGLAQGVRDVRREAADQVGLGGGEADAPSSRCRHR